MVTINHGTLTPRHTVGYGTLMKETATKPNRKQLGVRIDQDLIIEAKVLAVRKGQGLNDLVEEALKDLLKKYKGKV